ncbi:unnamed protein product [Lupinus luteus]|uniref:Uncharacterized protein n=1 Tax=Lupinus luteus TaxID=3873 RepID=A0AAV1WUF2_LUPLU
MPPIPLFSHSLAPPVTIILIRLRITILPLTIFLRLLALPYQQPPRSKEEFQIQPALAISASNSESRYDERLGSHQIDSRRNDYGVADALSRQYWICSTTKAQIRRKLPKTTRELHRPHSELEEGIVGG